MNKITVEILKKNIRNGLKELLDKDWDFVSGIIGPNYLLYLSIEEAVDFMPVAELRIKLGKIERRMKKRGEK
jgi:uncharacterized phage-like protein YoqJ